MEKYKTRLSIGIYTLMSFYTIVLKPMESIKSIKRYKQIIKKNKRTYIFQFLFGFQLQKGPEELEEGI